MELIGYLLSGAAAGLISGLFGVGGGIIIVPILSVVFAQLNFPTAHLMHLAIGTSLATIVVNAISSTRGHHRRANIDWSIIKNTLLACVLGVILGAWLAASIHSDHLKVVFSLFECMVAVKLLLEGSAEDHVSQSLSLSKLGSWAFGGFVGLISSLLGIGGGTVSVPVLMYLKMPTRRAIGTSAAIGLPISIIGTISYIFTGWHIPQLPTYSLGFVYMPAFFGIALGSLFTTQLGVRLAHHLPIKILKKLLATLLLVIGLKMLYSVLG
ncbi:MAG TPA: sulfite exporter TauE/SafE family protein [Methylophilaceae bacterium]|jgi:uncharacterized membrane protein YfcA